MQLPFQNNGRTTESDVLQRAVGKDQRLVLGARAANLREGKSGAHGSWSPVTPASMNDVIRTLNTPKTLQRRCEASTSLSPAVGCPALPPPGVHFSGIEGSARLPGNSQDVPDHGRREVSERSKNTQRHPDVLTHAQRFPTGFSELLTYNGVGPEYGLRATQQFSL
ncbi:hypothetical protein E5288_WYG007625 [Bos mutus]|uniref:Uncharacterized protein n=1 Tax=Bos mutus TaxID=72004 RepID=A0A6B0REA2_9CETA|nr:hypothetical protein [Bos mutus]